MAQNAPHADAEAAGTGADPGPWAVPYDGRASLDDIAACFRLLLGRAPDREEWAGHSSRAGEPLDAVVGSYVNSLEFARRRLSEADQADDQAVAALEGFRLFASPSDVAVGRHVLAGHYEDEVAAVFRSVLRPGMGVIDIGANIGFFTMLSAARVGPGGSVLAVEPNPSNARMVEASRVLNGFSHVTVLQAAAGREVGLLTLNTSHSNGTTSPLEVGSPAILSARTVPCLALDALVPRDRRIDLIKVDVEGAEYNALLGCAGIIERCRPVIVSEFSPGMLPGISGLSGPDYLAWLQGFGYELLVIEKDGSLTSAEGDPERVMRSYRARVTDHIDIVARPLGARGGARGGTRGIDALLSRLPRALRPR